MCRIDEDAGDWRVYRERDRCARKSHRCDECGRTIFVGETYVYRGGIIAEGDPLFYKACAHCEVLVRWLSDTCGGFIFTQVVDEILEHAQDYSRDDLSELVKLARAKWANVNGLVSPPEPPAELVV